jgi:N-acetylgalactosamine kinase
VSKILTASHFLLDRSWKLNSPKPEWQDYIRCGIRGILDYFSIGDTNLDIKGFDILVTGNLLPASGLSSSSALVVASAVAASIAWNREICTTDLAELCAKSERYIGTEGGGMDQAICLLASEGTARLIEFNPLKSTAVTLPPGAMFIVCHSMIKSEKAATDFYNCRVVECRLACQVSSVKFELQAGLSYYSS